MRTALCHLSLPGNTALLKLTVGRSGMEQTLRCLYYDYGYDQLKITAIM